VNLFEQILKDFAEDVNNAAKRTLGSRKIGKNRSYGVASRSLQKSLTYSIRDGKVSFGSPLPYAAFIHWGVNGTNKNRNAPFSYRQKQPPTDAIRKWMKVKPIRVRDKDGRFVKATESRLQSAAFLIARSIKRNGIHGLRYYEVALETVVPQYNKKLGEALAQEFVKDMKFKTGNITIKSK
jgi:phage gpG-like protein